MGFRLVSQLPFYLEEPSNALLLLGQREIDLLPLCGLITRFALSFLFYIT